MDIDHLRTFVVTSETTSFSVAAGQLHITQPAVSKRIAALENHIGKVLFDRMGKDIQLTPAGRELLPKAQELVNQFDVVLKNAASSDSEVRGELHVATSHHLGMYKLPEALRQFASDYPDINLRFEFHDSEIAFTRISEGKCELAVITIPPKVPSILTAEALWDEPLIFVSSRDSHIPERLSTNQLSQEPALLPDLSTYTGRLIQDYFDQHHIPLTTNMMTNYFETLKMLVKLGFGWSALPAPMVDDSLKVLEVNNVAISRKLGVVYHSKRTLSRQAVVFLNLLRAL